VIQYRSDHVMMMPSRFEPEVRPPRLSTLAVVEEVEEAFEEESVKITEATSCRELIAAFQARLDRLLSPKITFIL